MNIDEYVVDETHNSAGDANWLIDPRYEEPNELLTSPSEIALARIAAVIHKNAPALAPEQLEQAVRWLKAWKHKNNRAGSDSRSTWDFYEELDDLRNSHEQNKLQNRAWVQLGIAGLCLSAFLVTLLLAVISNYSDERLGWGAKALVMCLLFIFGGGVNKYTIKGLMTAKEQDRKYLMASIRAATTASEVNASGLFAYLPGTVWEAGQTEDGKLGHRSMCAAREQLTDALYRDPDDLLGPSSSLLRR